MAKFVNNDKESYYTIQNDKIEIEQTASVSTTNGDINYCKDTQPSQYQQYFENNCMRPMLFRASKIPFTSGNSFAILSVGIKNSSHLLIDEFTQSESQNSLKESFDRFQSLHIHHLINHTKIFCLSLKVLLSIMLFISPRTLDQVSFLQQSIFLGQHHVKLFHNH